MPLVCVYVRVWRKGNIINLRTSHRVHTNWPMWWRLLPYCALHWLSLLQSDGAEGTISTAETEKQQNEQHCKKKARPQYIMGTYFLTRRGICMCLGGNRFFTTQRVSDVSSNPADVHLTWKQNLHTHQRERPSQIVLKALTTRYTGSSVIEVDSNPNIFLPNIVSASDFRSTNH